MKVLHVVPYLPKASGVTTFVVACSDALQKMGAEQVVAVKDRQHFDVAPSRTGVPRIGVAEALERIEEFNVVHLHGIWPPFLHCFVVSARHHRIPIVWSLHGMLSPWAMKFKWWKKALPWLLWQKRDLKAAAILHVTSEKEQKWVLACCFKNRIVNIPLGTNLPEAVPVRRHEKKTLLFVGRINYIKALDNLIRAWKLSSPAGWKLRIVGLNEMNCQTGLENLTKELQLDGSVEFPGPKFGKDLEDEYKSADALVLPSHTENFGGVVIDALAWGLPVITSKGTPWSEVEGEKEVVVESGSGRGEVVVESGSGTVEFVDLEPGDTFDQIEQYLRQRVLVTFENKVLDISASIGSKRNANELAKHMAAGESPEVHKFAAKNIGALFERGVVAVVHYDKKAIDETREKPKIIRVFSSFLFADVRYVATITLKVANAQNRLYAVEALDIMRDERLEVHLAAKPRHFKTTRLLAERIAYYVGDVNRTHPAFLGRSEPFSIERVAELIRDQVEGESGERGEKKVVVGGGSGTMERPDSNTQTLKHSNNSSRCGWWVSNDPATLAKALRELMSLSDEERQTMGMRGREWVREKYSWTAVADQMKDVYESLLRGH